MAGDEKYNSGEIGGADKPLTDYELAELLGDEITPEKRASLVERLHRDPVAAEVLALAMSEVPDDAEGLRSGKVDRLLKMVRESKSQDDICPHCAGDLHPEGSFCPHCAARVRGNTLNCHKCGNPVVEGSSYCPSCGSVFKPMTGKSVLDAPVTMLIIGLMSVLIAFLYRPWFLFFMGFGLLMLGGWGWDFWTVRIRVKHAKVKESREEASDDEEERERKRKSV